MTVSLREAEKERCNYSIPYLYDKLSVRERKRERERERERAYLCRYTHF